MFKKLTYILTDESFSSSRFDSKIITHSLAYKLENSWKICKFDFYVKVAPHKTTYNLAVDCHTSSDKHEVARIWRPTNLKINYELELTRFSLTT